MKKQFNLVGSLLLIILLFVGCNSINNNDSNKDSNLGENSANDLAGTVSITGSTSVEKILYDMMDEFMAYNPDVTINYTGTGSSSGISDTLTFANDIGVSSREIRAAEKKDELKEVIFAYDGIAVVVHPNNPIKNLSLSDLVRIYNGEITNWKTLGGKDSPIVMVSREDASGTRTAFEELIDLGDAGGLTLNATVVEGNGNVQATVAGNENAIGYVSFAFIRDDVKSVMIDGVEATAENAKEGKYLLARPFLMVYMESKLSPVGREFLKFVVSEEGQNFVTEHGGIRVD